MPNTSVSEQTIFMPTSTHDHRSMSEGSGKENLQWGAQLNSEPLPKKLMSNYRYSQDNSTSMNPLLHYATEVFYCITSLCSIILIPS